MKIKIAALLLAVLMLVPIVASCANGGDQPADVTTTEGSDTTVAPVVTTDPTVTTEFAEDDLPDNIDFGGEKITVYYWSDRQFEEYTSDGPNGDNVNDAIFSRNEYVQERLNDEFVFIGEKGNGSNYQTWATRAENDYKGDKEFDILSGYSAGNALLAQRGLCDDLMLYSDTINFSKPWWPSAQVKEATIGDKLYFATGDISLNLILMMQCIYFNKNLIEEYDLESPYELVLDRKWTVDKLLQMSENKYLDTLSDGKSTDDMYGITISSTSNAYDTLFYSCGLTTMEKDEDDLPMISPTWNSEKTVNVLQKVLKSFYSDDCYHVESGPKDVFKPGNCLFLIGSLNLAMKTFVDINFFGIVPAPLYDEYQEDYVTQISAPHTLYSIASYSSKKEHAATYMEAMASASYRTVTPEVFAVSLQSKYVSDEESSQMLDIMRSTINFDIGHSFSVALGNIPNALWRNCIKNNTPNFNAEYLRSESNLKASLEALINTLS